MKLTREMWDEHPEWSSRKWAEVTGEDSANVRAKIRRWGGRQPTDPNAALMKLLGKARTEAEIEAAGFTLATARKVEGYDLFETRNERFELVYLLLPKVVERIDYKRRSWAHRWAVDEAGNPQPYLMVQLPDSKWDKVKVVPLADVHFGATACMVEKLREYVAWIAENDNTFCFLNGDILENSHGDSNHGTSHYESDVRPRDQVTEVARILAPIAHKILWAHPGNHEDRSRVRDYDPLERVCELLGGIPYSYEPVYADVLWRGNVFSFHAKHGNTGSQTKGGKMNAAMRPQKFQDFTMFTVMSHVHDGDVSRNTRICRDRENFRLVFRKQYTVITPSFYAYFGSYGSKAGYEPGSYGSINMDLFPNGDYHANA